MPSWKKILVSGSSAHVLDVTASSVPTGTTEDIVLVTSTGAFRKITQASFQGSIGQYAFTASADTGTPSPIASQQTLNIVGGLGIVTAVSNAGGTTYVTASVNAGNGIAIVSDTVTVNTGSVHFISGSRSTLIGTGIFSGSSQIPNSSITNAQLANSAVTITAGAGLANGGAVSLGSSVTLNVGAGSGITVNADDVQLKNAGSLSNNTIPKWTTSSTQLANSIITDDGTTVTVGGFLSANRISSTGAITGSAVSSSGTLIGNSITSATTILAAGNITTSTGNIGTTSGNITTTNGYVRAGNPAGAPGALGSVEAESFFTNGAVTAGSVSVSGNAIITGNLTVNGTTTTVNTTNVTVTDAFVLLASGSSGTVDGGIIVQNAANAGEALYWENNPSGTGRWAVSSSVAPTATTAAATNFIVTANAGTVAPASAPYYGGTGSGYGNIYVNTSTGDIFIYS